MQLKISLIYLAFMENKLTKNPYMIFALALVLASFILAGALEKIKNGSRYVSVRGLSERQVVADLALWPVKATATANTLPEIYRQIETSQKLIQDYLLAKGFKAEEINVKQPRIDDRQAQLYNNYEVNQQRYIADFGVLIRTNNIKLVKDAMQGISELVGKGVSLSSNEIEYLYTKLNEIKPEMIEEATLEARKAADKFAKNSRSRIKGIKYAYQGIFTIEPIHYYTQELKNVRVVTDIEYYLG